jgi:hypothetical protein
MHGLQVEILGARNLVFQILEAVAAVLPMAVRVVVAQEVVVLSSSLTHLFLPSHL